jgi:hypothetical protein
VPKLSHRKTTRRLMRMRSQLCGTARGEQGGLAGRCYSMHTHTHAHTQVHTHTPRDKRTRARAGIIPRIVSAGWRIVSVEGCHIVPEQEGTCTPPPPPLSTLPLPPPLHPCFHSLPPLPDCICTTGRCQGTLLRRNLMAHDGLQHVNR